MNIDKITLAKLLTYAGSIPFIFLTILNLKGIHITYGIDVKEAMISYAAIILTFVAAIHFAYGIMQEEYAKSFLIKSNVIALASWFALMIEFKFAILIILTGFIITTFIEICAFKKSVIPEWFFKLRIQISIIVIICLSLNL
ncbi:MAG: DUF3429 domain-containing protein [Rickettsiales bacterium]|nr:DUF3429 domain-containing protein [Rickettsiales bacterium]